MSGPFDPEAFRNRLAKVAAHRLKWARRRGLTAFRVYDGDVPDVRFVVEWYAGRLRVREYRRNRSAEQRPHVLAAVRDVFGVGREAVFHEVREPKTWGVEQHGRLDDRSARFVVEEAGLKFWVNLSDRIDTGLFLDHRETRARVGRESRGRRVLNLFAYTGAFTVHAAAGGAAATTSVDLSNTYLEWTRDNLALNGLDDPRHELVRSDVTRWVRQDAGRRFDLVVLDPPPFSVSKKMVGSFDVQRDHPELLAATLRLLDDGGILYFSTSFKGFDLDARCLEGWRARELTPRSIPEDFRDREVHRCWRVTR